MRYKNTKRIIFIAVTFFVMLLGFNPGVCSAAYASESLQLYAEGTDNPDNPDGPESPDNPGEEEEAVNILFVGNSFTSYKDDSVKKYLDIIADTQGKNVNIEMITNGSARLSYYVNASYSYADYYRDFRIALLTKKWDYIILQEQSRGSIELSESGMYDAVEELSRLIKIFQPDAKTLLYMTHAYNDGSYVNVNGVSTKLDLDVFQYYIQMSYNYIGQKLGINVVPVGLSFSRIKKLAPEINLIGPDNKHPNSLGFFVSATCFYKEIFGELPVYNEDNYEITGFSEEQLDIINKSATGMIKLSKSNIITGVGNTFALSCYINSEGDEFEGWRSLNDKVASVDQNGNVTANSEGETLIIAESKTGLHELCYVFVEDATLYNDKFIFDTGRIVLEKKSRIKMLPVMSTSVDKEKIKWSTNDSSIAVVDEDGVVTAVNSGRTTVKIKDSVSGKYKSYYVYVKLKPTTAIKAVTNIAVGKANNLANIKLTWAAAGSATKYDVYRSDSKNGVYTLIGQTSARTFIDTTAASDVKYYYKLVSGNKYLNCKSEMSEVYAEAIVPGTPAITKYSASNTSINIKWRRNKKVTGYVIYRSSNNGKTYKKLATIEKNSTVSYTDRTVVKGKTYRYKVRAYKTVGTNTYRSNYSPSVKVKAKKKKK